MQSSTCITSNNIAVIKYWGKENVILNTPINSSYSVTLNAHDLNTTTTISSHPSFTFHRFFLNNIEENEIPKRILNLIQELIPLSSDPKFWEKAYFHIITRNSFPTAAGLASSASGYACFVASLSHLMSCTETFQHELTTIARKGSGSACRSLYGGFVEWERGHLGDGSDSLSTQIQKSDYWPELEMIICVANANQKETSSTTGMQRSKATSLLLAYRAQHIVDGRLKSIKEAVQTHDFATFGQIMMQDSNQFHACCLDTYPPIFYLNDVSKQVIAFVHAYNEFYGEIKLAYTFDAGANAVLFMLNENVKEVMSCLLTFFPPSCASYVGNSFIKGQSKLSDYWCSASKVPSALKKTSSLEIHRGGLTSIYHTTVGEGSTVLSDPKESLADPITGLPKKEGCISTFFSSYSNAILFGTACIAGAVCGKLHFKMNSQ